MSLFSVLAAGELCPSLHGSWAAPPWIWKPILYLPKHPPELLPAGSLLTVTCLLQCLVINHDDATSSSDNPISALSYSDCSDRGVQHSPGSALLCKRSTMDRNLKCCVVHLSDHFVVSPVNLSTIQALPIFLVAPYRGRNFGSASLFCQDFLVVFHPVDVAGAPQETKTEAFFSPTNCIPRP